MLTMMRNLLRSKLAGILFGIIIISMAVWGTENIFSGNLGANYVSAGGRQVSEAEFDQSVERELARLRSQDQVMSRPEAVERGVIDNVFSQQAARIRQVGYMHKIGATLSDKGFQDYLLSVDVFKGPEGTFSTPYYRSAIGQQNYSTSTFEAAVRDDAANGYRLSAAQAALTPPVILGRLQAAYVGELRRISWIRMTSDMLGEDVAATPEQLIAFYNSRTNAYLEPERRQISVLNIIPQDFVSQVEVTPESVESYYEAQKAKQFSLPEKRTFIEAVFTTEQAALDAIGVIGAGRPVEDIKGALSVQTRTASKAQLGDQTLADALFNQYQPVKSILQPIQSGDAWIIGRIEEIIPGDPVPLDDALRSQIQTRLSEEKAKLKFDEVRISLDDLIGEGKSLAEMGAELGVPVLSYAPVDANGVTENGVAISAIRQGPELLAEVFSIPQNEISARIETDASITLAIVDKIIAERVPPYEDVASRVASDYTILNKADGLANAASALKSRIDAGDMTLAQAAQSLATNVVTPDQAVSRTNFNVPLPQNAGDAIFNAAEGNVVIVRGLAIDETYLIHIDEVDPLSEDEMTVLAPGAAQSLRESLNRDIIIALDTEFAKAADFDVNASAFQSYKSRILAQQ